MKTRQTLYPRNVRYVIKKLYPRRTYRYVHSMGLERIFGDFDARRGNLPTYLIHFKWTFHVDRTTP